MHHGTMETICLFGMTYSVLQTSRLLFVPAFKFRRAFFKVVSLDKDPIY